MSNAGTFELVLKYLAEALVPLAEELSPGFLHEMGVGMPASWHTNGQLIGAMNNVQSVSSSLSLATTELQQAIDGGDALQIIAKGVVLGERVSTVIQSAIQLGETVNQLAQGDASLSAAQKAHFQNFFDRFIPRILESMAVRLLEEKVPKFYSVLDFMGFAEKNLINEDSEDFTQPPYLERRLELSRLVDLFNSPASYLQDLTDLGTPAFDGRKLFERIEKITRPLDFPTQIIDIGGQPPIFEMFLLSLQANSAFNPPALGFELRIPGNGQVENTYPLIAPWSLKTSFGGSFAAGIQGVIDIPNNSFVLQPPMGEISLTVSNELIANNPERLMLLVGLPGGTRLEVGKVSFGNTITANWNPSEGTATFDPSFSLALEEGKLTLDFSGGDGFLSTAIPLEAAEANFSLNADFTADKVMIQGSGGLELQFPSHISLGPLDIESIYFIVNLFDPKPVSIELSSSLKLNLGPLVASVDRLGANVSFDIPDDGQGNLGPLDFALGFKPPNGVGLSVDAGVVKGGGYLYFDFDNEEYAGALELTFAEFLSLKAIGLITTKMPDGSDGFSMIIIITAEFTIQLGFGFVFLGAGGLLGLHRTMKLEPLAEGVRTGATSGILFPTNVVENAPKIISDLKVFFPVEEGKFLIGPMVKLGWGTPTLISISLGIIIEIRVNNGGGIERIAILGVLKCILPDEEAALLVLQVSFIGAIDFQKKNAFFFASIFESRVLFITIEGEMGVLVAWGDDSNFVVSVGGFHPRFNPPPLPFPVPKRVALNILNESWGKIRVEGYFAVTTNTVQLGCKLELYFGFSEFKIEGHLAFDALFQFDPFYFIIEISGKVSLKVFGFDLFTISLKFSLEGTSPWRATGYGKLKILFFSFKAKFDKTWGDSKNTKLPPISIVSLLEAELQNVQNWQALEPASTSGLLVTLREVPDSDDSLALHPVGTLRVSQRALPLKIHLDKFGSKKPDDANKLDIEVSGPLQKISDIKESFARAQFQEMKDSKKLSSPAYEKEVGGLELSVTGDQTQFGKITVRHVRYELITIDTAYKRLRIRFFNWSQQLFVHFFANSAVRRASVSNRVKKEFQPFDEKIDVRGGAYTVAFNKDNTPFSGEATNFESMARADEFINELIANDPQMADAVHTIPNNEVNLVP
jgi:hypothetical protein